MSNLSERLALVVPDDQVDQVQQQVQQYEIFKSPFEAAVSNIPAIGASPDGDDKTVWLHYYAPGHDWYITEVDFNSGMAHGLANTGSGTETENIDINELKKLPNVHVNIAWTPKPQSEVLGEIHKECDMKNTNYYKRLITWDVITESEYNSLSVEAKENYKYYGSAPAGYFNQGDSRKGYLNDRGRVAEVSEIESAIRKIAEENQPRSLCRSLYAMYSDAIDHSPSLLTRFLEFISTLPGKYRDYFTAYPFYVKGENQEFAHRLPDNIYNLIPESYKKLTKVKPLAFSPEPNDRNLKTITAPFVDGDSHKLILHGVYFGTEGIVATNANILLFLNRKRHGQKGVYCMHSDCWKHVEGEEENADNGNYLVKLFNQQYPDFKKIIPKEMKGIVRVNVNSVRKYCYTFIQSRLLEYSLPFKFPAIDQGDESMMFWFSMHLMADAMDTMLRLGHDQVDIGYSYQHGGVIIAPKGQVNNASSVSTDFILLMPVFYERQLSKGEVYFDMDEECLHCIGHEPVCFNPEVVATEIIHRQAKEIENLKTLKSKEKEDLENEALLDSEIKNEKLAITNKILSLQRILLDPSVVN